MKKPINKSVRKQARRTRALERFTVFRIIPGTEEGIKAYDAYLERKGVELTALELALGVKGKVRIMTRPNGG